MTTTTNQERDEAMREWQPIETAPKDGTRILVYEPSGGLDEVFACVWGVYWPGPRNVPEYAARRANGWVEFDGMDDRQTVDEPTHWMPLPVPPPNQEHGEG
jgi:hypothetical protein